MTRAQGLATARVGEKRCPPGVQKTIVTQMGEKRCPVVLPGMGRARCPTLGKIKASGSNREYWPMWIPGSGRCSRLSDSSGYTTVSRLRVF